MEPAAPLRAGPTVWSSMILPWKTTALVTLIGAALGAFFSFLIHRSWDRAFSIESFLVFAASIFLGQWMLRALDRRARRPPADPRP
jgi:hypothetical protein